MNEMKAEAREEKDPLEVTGNAGAVPTEDEPAEDAMPHPPANASAEEDPLEATGNAGAELSDNSGSWGLWFQDKKERLLQKRLQFVKKPLAMDPQGGCTEADTPTLAVPSSPDEPDLTPPPPFAAGDPGMHLWSGATRQMPAAPPPVPPQQLPTPEMPQGQPQGKDVPPQASAPTQQPSAPTDQCWWETPEWQQSSTGWWASPGWQQSTPKAPPPKAGTAILATEATPSWPIH